MFSRVDASRGPSEWSCGRWLCYSEPKGFILRSNVNEPLELVFIRRASLTHPLGNGNSGKSGAFPRGLWKHESVHLYLLTGLTTCTVAQWHRGRVRCVPFTCHWGVSYQQQSRKWVTLKDPSNVLQSLLVLPLYALVFAYQCGAWNATRGIQISGHCGWICGQAIPCSKLQ